MEEKMSVSKVKIVQGSYMFRIEGFSTLSNRVGDSIESPEFSLCTHDWQLRIFPGGSLESHRGYISFYLASKSTRMARASYKLQVLSQLQGGIHETFVSSGVRVFEPKGVQVDGWGRDKFMSVSILLDPLNGFLVDDSVIFKVEISVIGDLETLHPYPIALQASKLPNLESSMRELLEKGISSDIKIIVGDKTFLAHRCILCNRSSVFTAMLSTCELEEHKTGVIRIRDFDSYVVEEMLHFIYTDQLKDPSALAEIVEELFSISTIYQIPALLALSENALCEMITIESAIPLLLLGDSHGSMKIKEKAFHFIANNYSEVMQQKEFQELEGDLQREVQLTIDIAIRRRGCRPGIENERRFTNSCKIM